MGEFNLEGYLSTGVENIIKSALKSSLSNPKESLFMAQYAMVSKYARKKREKAEKIGEHIPPFLIASITSECNLHCMGCYARSNYACLDQEAEDQMNEEEWAKVFEEAMDMGIGFILLAGGEPLVRKDIILAAGKSKDILFPIFTNGTMIDEAYTKLFEKNRNLVPILSIEGNQDHTDGRRGEGIYEKLIQAMEQLQKNKILYGASITVTKENLLEVTSEEFVESLYQRGCKVIFYIEYVPVSADTKELAPEDEDRKYLKEKMLLIRQTYDDMLIISFPGDEKSSGGCLAAGRGFFHINAHGGAEPCPFSPYSDCSVKDTSLREALQSPLFRKLQENGILLEEHIGGCVLFEREDKVKEYLSKALDAISNI